MVMLMGRIKNALLLTFLTITLGSTASAAESMQGCFIRNYSDAHLAKHPNQLVTSVRLFARRNDSREEFFLELKLRGRSESLSTAGICLDQDSRSFHCFVDCNGGGINIRPQSSHVMMYLDQITMKKTCDMNPGDIEGNVVVSGGLDDRVFRIDRVNDAACRGMKFLDERKSADSNDFPIASCKSWNGTIVRIEGIDSTEAVMTGIVTEKNLLEYCERDPGGETIEYGGKLTVQQCVKKYGRETQKLELRSIANCRDGSIVFGRSSARFPLEENADTSCGSGMPPLIAQFQMLCPANARRWNVGGR